jgi:hypothetical protein
MDDLPQQPDALLEAGVLFAATSHVCKNSDCRGPKHYWRNGHWMQVYNISLPMLQNATLLKEKLWSILLREQCSKTPKSNVAKRDATQESTPTPPAVAETDSSALTSRENKVSELLSEDNSVAALPRAVAEHEQPLAMKTVHPNTPIALFRCSCVFGKLRDDHCSRTSSLRLATLNPAVSFPVVGCYESVPVGVVSARLARESLLCSCGSPSAAHRRLNERNRAS